ncbi:hypothetical protein [Aquitalea aquatilis]|uniref:hypothetical protein n=1 Tax=Aquitalea aquatilis TaxID=1537400 RepID=UPI0010BD28F8|nr:hypothetical protein [Aquitalea aquatilis]
MKTADMLAYYAADLSRAMPDNRGKVRWALQLLGEFMPPVPVQPDTTAADKAKRDWPAPSSS